MKLFCKLMFPVLIANLSLADSAVAADKTQAWGARIKSSQSATMRNRNQNARVWVGEHARGWGLGSRITNTLTTSMAFQAQSAQKALENIKTSNSQTNNYVSSACGNCVTFQNSGNNYSITNTMITSVNTGSVTSTAIFNN